MTASFLKPPPTLPFHESNTENTYTRNTRLENSKDGYPAGCPPNTAMLATKDSSSVKNTTEPEPTMLDQASSINHSDPSFSIQPENESPIPLTQKDSINFVYPPQHVLRANRFTIDMLTRSPGTSLFSFWFTVSTFTPTILACLGPLANMISIAAIVDPWRLSSDDTHVIHDKSWVLAINILSLVVGFAANILLVLNFTGKIKYTFAQVGSILMWLFASAILAVDLFLVWKRNYFSGYDRSGGYFFGCFTCGIYFVCFLLLLINYSGYLLNEYDETFILDESQRGLMIHTVLLGVWLVVGAGMFSHLIGPVPYSLSMYFCSITVLTIGLGDVVPLTNVARALSLAFTFFGVLELGLVIAWLRQFILSNIGPTLFWHRLEKARKRLLKSLAENNIVLTGKQSFEAMTRLRVQCELQERVVAIVSTLASYLVFWLMGALVFCRVENWTYFNATYFCFLCLLTTGYGDLAPKTSLGRSFFVIWALAAIPMMTILISSVGDALFAIATHLDDFLSSMTGLKEFYQEKHTGAHHIYRFLKRKAVRHDQQTSSRQTDTGPSLQTLTALSSLITRDSQNNSGTLPFDDDGGDGDDDEILRASALSNLTGLEYRKESLRIMQCLLETTNSNAEKIHSFEEWAEVLFLVGKDPTTNMYFLGDESPLRYPLKEVAYMLDQVMTDFQIRTDDETENSQSVINESTAVTTGTDFGEPVDDTLEIERSRSRSGSVPFKRSEDND